MVSGLANPGKVTREGSGDEAATTEPSPATAYIFSDGRFEDVTDLVLEHLEPVYVPVGSFVAPNLAITAVSTRRNEDRP